MENKIKKITIISESGFRCFEVGYEKVELIKDVSAEFENSLTLMYAVYGKDNEELHRIENCPVVVDYK